MNLAVDYLVLDGRTVVNNDLHHFTGGTLISEGEGVLLVRNDIVFIGGQFLQVVAAERKIGLTRSGTVIAHGNDLQQTICRDDGAVFCNQFLGGIETEGDGRNFAIHADLENIILLHDFAQSHRHFLTQVGEAGGGFGDLDFLTCIDQFNGVRFGIDDHTLRGGDFGYMEFAEIQGLAGGVAGGIGGNGVHHFACGIAERTIHGENIFCCGNLIDSTGQTLFSVHGLIYAFCNHGRGEDFAGLIDGDGALLGGVGLGDLNNGDAAVLGGIILSHIEVHRIGVDDIAIGSLDFDQSIAGAVLQRFGGDEEAILVGVEGVDFGDLGIGEGLLDQSAVGIVNLESGTCVGDDLAGFCIDLNDLQEGLKGGIIDDEAVDFAVFADEHIEVCHQLTAVPAGDLVNRVDAIGQFLGLGEAVLITGQIIPFRFLGGIVAACGLQVDTEHGTRLRGFNLSVAIVAVLDDGDRTLLDGLQNAEGGGVQFDSILLSVCTDGIRGVVQQIAFRGGDLPDGPVVTADIVTGGELTVGVGGVSVDQLIALVNAVLGTGERTIALGSAGGSVGFGDGHIPLFQNVGEALVRDGIPFDGSSLAVGDDILFGSIHFLQSIARANQDIVEVGDAIAVGDGILVNGQTGERSAIQVEGDALVQTIFGILRDSQGTTLQRIVKGHSGNLTADNCNSLGVLRIILIVGLLGDGVDTGGQVVNLDFTVLAGGHSLVDALTADIERNALHDAVFGGLDNLGAAEADSQFQITLHGIVDGLGISDSILRSAVRAVLTIRPGDNAHTLGVLLGSGDGNSFCGGFLCGNAKGVAVHGKIDAGNIGGKGVVLQNAVLVGQFSHIFAARPVHLDFLCLLGTLGKAGRQLGVLLYIGFDGIVIAVDAVIQGMLGGDGVQHRIIFARIDLTEVAVTLAHDGFPDQKLSCHRMSKGITAGILGTPAQRHRAGIAVLKNTTDEGLNLVTGDGAVQFFGEVIPEIFVPAGKHFTGILCNAGFDAVADISVIGIHRSDVGVVALGGNPAIHVMQFGVAPAVEVRFAVTRETDHVNFCLFTGSVGGDGTTAQKCHQAHHHSHSQGGASFENTRVHCKSS